MNRSRGGFDVVFTLDDRVIGFNLAHTLSRGGLPAKPAVMSSELAPGRLDEQIRNADLPRVIDNLDAGMGYSRRLESVPNGYAYALPGYTRSPGAIFMPAGKLTEITLPALTAPYNGQPNLIATSARFNNQLYLVTGGPEVLRIAADGQSATAVASLGPTWTGVGAAVFNNQLYVSGMDGGIATCTAAGAWSAPNLTVRRRDLAVANWRPQGIPTDVLIGVASDLAYGAVRWCPVTADPMNAANWSAPVSIGHERQYAVGPILATPRHAFIAARDGIYDIDELGVRAFNIAPWIGEGLDAANGQWGMARGNGLYYAHSQGLAFVETTGETQYRPEWAHPGWGLPYEGAVQGAPVAGTLHDGWGLLALNAPAPAGEPGSQGFLMAGRRAAEGAKGLEPSHVWHGAEAIVPGVITHMRVYTQGWQGGAPLLLVTSYESGPNRVRAFWMSLARFGSPLADLISGGPFQPADLSTLFLPADPWNRPSAVKQLLQIDLLAERLQPETDVLKVWAAADGGEMVEQGTADADRYTSLAPSPALVGRSITPKVEAQGHPILRSLELRAAMGVQTREARTYQLVLAWDNALKGARSRETADPERRLADLHALMGQVCLLDDGASGGPSRVRVLQVLPAERKQIGGPQRAGAHGAEGAWAIVAGVTVSFLDTPFRWDGHAGDQFDRERSWS